MKNFLRKLADYVRLLTVQVIALDIPEERKSRIVWLLVALFCELHDVAEDEAWAQSMRTKSNAVMRGAT